MAGQRQRISKWRRKRRCSFLYAVRKRGVEEEAERGRGGWGSVCSETQGLGMRRAKKISGLAASGAYEGASQVPGKWPLRKYSDAREIQGMHTSTSSI